MRKLSCRFPDLDGPDHRRPRRVIHALFALTLLLLVMPVAYEIVILCLSNWQAMYGRIGHVETPILDRLLGAWNSSRWMIRSRLHGAFHNLPWRPSLIIGLGFAWALFMTFPLRRN